MEFLITKLSVPYSALCDTFEKCSTTTKRLEIIGFLTSFFHAVLSLSPNSLNQCIYLCLNRIGPEYDTKELGVGESILIKAIAEAAGQTAPSIKSKLNQIGDLGTVAEKVVGTQKRFFGKKQSLTVESVFKSLTEIANFSGANSQNRRMGEIRKMLIDVSSVEARYLVRCLSGKLRIGLAEKTVLIALAKAVVLREQDKSRKRWSPSRLSEEFAQAEKVLKQVYTEIPTYDIIVPHLIVHGMENIQETCKLTPGIPVKPMLAHPTKSLSEILDRFEGIPFTCEFKYDGERAQIHLTEMGAAMVYSRNSENLSGKYPDIIARVPKIYKEGVTSFVLDCEAVAWDRNKSCILPFQAITTRKRKDVSEESIQVQCCVFAFDLLYLNGESLVSHTLQSRREKLYANFNEIPGEFTFAKAMSATAVEDIQTFLDAAVEGNCEGLMVKTLEKDSSYEPSQRSRNWLKVKKDYVNGLGDTLDLVVIGAYFGKGKRTGVYGGYLLACYDEDDEQYQSICKIGTGFSEEDLANHANLLKEHIIPKPPAYYEWSDTPNLTPDIWFSPAMVWEVKAADLSISPVHKAARGLVDPAKGVSLRFPRFVRIRDDKSPEDATKATQVETMYRAQKINNQDDAVMEDDY
ncbi:ATP-dependent DNA ligase [Cladochytrium replicatum]|nr:ATP-dependent DNA ligase [Cladochytrium replicatum]